MLSSLNERAAVSVRSVTPDYARPCCVVSTDSTDIVDGKMKLILGLMWTLILHYSISMPMWDSDEFGGAPPADQTPKQRLLGWIQGRIPDKHVGNFTTDWNDGTAVGALVDAVAPGTDIIFPCSLLGKVRKLVNGALCKFDNQV